MTLTRGVTVFFHFLHVGFVLGTGIIAHGVCVILHGITLCLGVFFHRVMAGFGIALHLITLRPRIFFCLLGICLGRISLVTNSLFSSIGICLGIHGSIDACIQVCHGSLTQQDRTGSSGQHPFTVHHRLLVKTQNSLVRNRESTLLQSGNGLK